MKLLKIPRRIHEQFQRTVRGNEEVTADEVARKLTRNSYLSAVSEEYDPRGIYYMYGKLHFIVNGDNTVVWMKNRQATPEGWKRNDELYLKLNKRLGIDNDITAVGLMVRDVFLHEPRDFNGMRWTIGNEVVVGDQWIY